MRMKHFSAGWRKYLKGTAAAENGWNIYAYAGLGIFMGRVENSHSVAIDTADYNVPVLSGTANFKRLTLDLGLGWELPLVVAFQYMRKEEPGFPLLIIPANIFL